MIASDHTAQFYTNEPFNKSPNPFFMRTEESLLDDLNRKNSRDFLSPKPSLSGVGKLPHLPNSFYDTYAKVDRIKHHLESGASIPAQPINEQAYSTQQATREPTGVLKDLSNTKAIQAPTVGNVDSSSELSGDEQFKRIDEGPEVHQQPAVRLQKKLTVSKQSLDRQKSLI